MQVSAGELEARLSNARRRFQPVTRGRRPDGSQLRRAHLVFKLPFVASVGFGD